MSLGLSTRSLGDGVSVAPLLARAQALDCRGLYLNWPWRVGEADMRALRAGGIQPLGGQIDLAMNAAVAARLREASQLAGRLRLPALIVDVIHSQGSREEAAQSLARALPPLLREGVPLWLRDAAESGGLLAGDSLQWILSDLPGLGLWVDPARRAAARGPTATGTAAGDALDAVAGRCGGVFVHARQDGADGGHPEEGGVDWAQLAQRLPRRVPWILDLGQGLAQRDVGDALRYLRMLLT